MTPPTFTRRLILPLASLILPPAVLGATIDKANNTIDLDQAGSWVGGVLPTSSDFVRWNNTVTGPNTVTTTSATAPNYAGLIVTDAGGPITLNGLGLTLGASGIDMSVATQDLTIDTGFLNFSNQSWNLAAGRTFTLNAGTGSSSQITMAGGTVVFTGAEDNQRGVFFVGGSAANPGVLILGKTSSSSVHSVANAFGTGLTINAFGTVRLEGSGGDQIGDATRVNVAGGTFDLNGRNETIASLSGTASGKVTNSGATAVTLTFGGTSSGTFNGVIEDGLGIVNLVKGTNFTQTLTGVNTYTGTTEVNAGLLVVTGSISGSAVTLNPGASLAGGGIVGPLTVTTGSLVAPAVSGPATLDVAGGLTLNGGTLSLVINGTAIGSYDQVATTGSVSLISNVALNLSLNYTPGFDSYTIIDNQSVTPISESALFTFKGEPLSEGEHFMLNGYDAVISYTGGTGNDVVISVPEPGSTALLLLSSLGVGLVRRRRC